MDIESLGGGGLMGMIMGILSGLLKGWSVDKRLSNLEEGKMDKELYMAKHALVDRLEVEVRSKVDYEQYSRSFTDMDKRMDQVLSKLEKQENVMVNIRLALVSMEKKLDGQILTEASRWDTEGFKAGNK